MSWLSSTSIKHRILIIPLVAVVAFAVYLGFNGVANRSNAARLADVQNVFFPTLVMADANLVYLQRMDELYTAAVATGEAENVNKADELHKSLKANLAKQGGLQAEQRDVLANVERALDSYHETAKGLAEGMLSGSADMAKVPEQVEQKNALHTKATEQLKRFRDSSEESFNATLHAANETAANTFRTGLGVAAVTVIVLLLISWSIASLVTRSLGSVVNSLKDIAQGEGDLTVRLKQTSKDEVGELVYWFNTFVEKLHGTIGEVVNVIAPLAKVAQDLSGVSRDTERTSSEQLKSSQVVTVAVDEMLGTVTHVAESATHAAQAAEDADAQARAGRDIVGSTVASIASVASEVTKAAQVIAKLEQDAEAVGSILDVIRAIADQTNLLALNAAIEAARAGEQGRGFAVVAEEVRTLASRTQASTREIQSVIETLQEAAASAVVVMAQSREKAESSVTQADQTGESFQAISGRVATISDLNQQIAAATEEQQRSSYAIQEQISGMRQASELSVRYTTQLAQLSGALQGLAGQLQSIAGQFRV